MLERLFPQQADDKLFVEDVFSTWLYTGNGSTQTITNGIDLAGKGGLVWLKARNSAQNHFLFDTNRGVQKRLISNSTAEEFELSDGLSAFNSNGFTLGSGYTANGSGLNVASWTFREAPNFFDVVTYTGNGGDNFVNHSLGVRPGFIIIKRTNASSNWPVVARTTGTVYAYFSGGTSGLSSTSGATVISESASRITATSFDAGWIDSSGNANAAGQPYVAYLFAHNTASDGIIQCGSFNNSGGLVTVTLGWEPQWILMKNAAAAGDWFMVDNMRGLDVGGSDPYLYANSAASENSGDIVTPTATGFVTAGLPGSTNFIYVAIRRGPMRTPTLGTSVYNPAFLSSGLYSAGFPIDFAMSATRTGDTFNSYVADRLRGGNNGLITTNTNAEYADPAAYFDNMLGYRPGAGTSTNQIAWMFKRAPGFMDVVCYTGNGTAGRTVNHNLGVAPELMIGKSRSGTFDWCVYHKDVGNTKAIYLNSNGLPVTSSDFWQDTTPTSSVFTIGNINRLNTNGNTQVMYLFASVPGVSKVGSYTGNGSSQTINCAFTTGARFVLIKRTDSTGDWYVWDSARGIVAGNDPYLALNSTAAEVTSNDSVDADSTGFIVNQVAASNINVNAATYIFLAIA